MLLHIGTFQLDRERQRRTRWHQLAPKTRILCAGLLVFAISLTPNGRWLTWAIYGLGVGAIVRLSRVSLSVLLRRVAVEFTFISVILLGTLFREGGAIVWHWGWLQVGTEGLVTLGSVTLKALLSLTTLNILTLTTAVPDLLHGLRALRVPPLLVAILASMSRYVGVLADEFNAMRRAALARNLMATRRWQRFVVGNMVGSLFIRTVERGERVHCAMLSRGYSGLLPAIETSPGTGRDVGALAAVGCLILLGQAVSLPLFSPFLRPLFGPWLGVE
jgi:cobalt/nickel transport system permease protein